MDTSQFVAAVAGNHEDPGHRTTPDDELRALINALELCDELCLSIAERSTSPVLAALFTYTVEQAHHRLEIAQIRAAQLAQRTLAQELPPETLVALRVVADAPGDYVRGLIRLPQDPATAPAGRPEFKNTAEFLQSTLGISFFEAGDRLHASGAFLPHTDVHGILQGPRYPLLARQVHAGKIRVSAASAAARKLDKLRPGIDAQPDAPDLAQRVEEQVAQSVAEETPGNTKRLFNVISDRLDGGPREPGTQEVRARTGVFVTRRTRYFTYMNVCMLNIDAEVFMSHFAQSDNPRTNAGNRQAMAKAATVPGGSAARSPSDSGVPPWFAPPASDSPVETLPQLQDFDFSTDFKELFNAATPGADGMTPPQRHLQTLLNLMRSAGKTARTKGTTGLPVAQLVVFAQLDGLLGLAKAAGYTAHGLEVPPATIRKMLCNAGVIPVVLGGDGEILDVGREMRLVPEHMKRAVLARDGGCIYPGCTVPPEHCEFNHIEQWQNGGATSVANLHPGCTNHHHMIDNGELRVVIHHGLPHVLLPRYLDPEQVPRRNTHWRPQAPTLF